MTKNLEDIKQIDRLIEYFSNKGVEGYQNIEKYLGLGAGFITKSKQRDGNLSGQVLAKLVQKCQDLNINWVISGIPPMLHDADFFKRNNIIPVTPGKQKHDYELNEQPGTYVTNYKEKYIETLEKYNELLIKYNALLEQHNQL